MLLIITLEQNYSMLGKEIKNDHHDGKKFRRPLIIKINYYIVHCERENRNHERDYAVILGPAKFNFLWKVVSYSLLRLLLNIKR